MDAVIDYVPQHAAAEPLTRVLRPSQAVNAGHYVRSGAIGIVLVWLYLALPAEWGVSWVFLLVPLALLFLREAWRWLSLRCISYRLDEERVVWSAGVLSRSTGSMEIFRVQNVTLHQSLFERLTGTGSILLETRDETNPYVRMLGMQQPEVLRKGLTTYVQRARRARGMQEAVVN